MFQRVLGKLQKTGHASLRRSTAIVSVLAFSLPAAVAQADICAANGPTLPAGCEAVNAGTAGSHATPPNVVVPLGVAPGSFGSAGFSISIDNAPFAGAVIPLSDQRVNDLRNDLGQLDVRYDGLDTLRLLNVVTTEQRNAYRPGETVTFRSSSSYPAFLDRAEVLIRDRDRPGAPVIARLPISANGTANFQMPGEGSGNLSFALRVYDANGRYDETHTTALIRTYHATDANDAAGSEPFAGAGDGQDNTARRGIPIRGGVVTVSGTATPNQTVTVMGETIPVDSNGQFVVSRILAPGDRVVTANINGRNYMRDVSIPDSEWFYVGIVDLVAGLREGGMHDAERETYTSGRAAFYVKGQLASGWTVTASADTSDGPISEMFSRLNRQDPQRVLERLRNEDSYPTMGDDSTSYDDTPSSGAVYLRLENDTTRFVLGDFRAGIAGPGLINNARDLYGVELAYQTASVTENGDPRAKVVVYGAQPETVAQRDILRGTGGSVYFLSRQDITSGSSTVTVQMRDPDSGYIVDSRLLVEGVDYTIDHFQGVIMLTAPLVSASGSAGLVGGGVSPYDVNLVVQYEYAPIGGLDSVSAAGGRAEVWATDELRVGASAMVEKTQTGDQQMIVGVDARYRLGDNSFAELELARTEGPGFSRAVSTDGGMTIASSGGATADAAQALRFAAEMDLQDLGFAREGHVGLHYESKEAGFSTLNEDITADQTVWGVQGRVGLTDRVALAFDTNQFQSENGIRKAETEVSVSAGLTERVTVEAGVSHLDKTTPLDAAQTGTRTDVGVRLAYALRQDMSVYVFGQSTVNQTGGLAADHRYGAGISGLIAKNTTLSAEVSDGATGLAARADLAYAPSSGSEIYLGYVLDPARSGAGSRLRDDGRIVVGGRYQHSEALSTYAETIFDQPGNQRSLLQAYGLTYAPNQTWTLGAGLETGRVRDSLDGDFDRTAISLGAVYTPEEDMSARLRLEYRIEDGEGVARDRETWGLSAGYENQVSDDWRLIADAELLYSVSADDAYRNGEYLNASLGYAYRPVDNEKLNALVRVGYLVDLPGEDQIGADGTTNGPKHRSVSASIAATYDIHRALTIGGKLGYRSSSVAERGSDDYTVNSATLLVGNLEWNAVGEWDIFAEGRVLYSPETGSTETGAVAAVYRHLGENLKVGVGYEWGSVSDVETDLNYQGQGLFLNVIAKF